MSNVILTPALAAAAVCHDEQMVVWANDMVAGLGEWLREDIDYSDVQLAVTVELRRIIEAAFDHPEAKTIRRR